MTDYSTIVVERDEPCRLTVLTSLVNRPVAYKGNNGIHNTNGLKIISIPDSTKKFLINLWGIKT